MNLKTDNVLTPAETRVAIAYTLGDIGKEVGSRLGIAYNTVVRHTQNIYDKAHIRRSTNALVAWFLAENYSINIGELARRIGAGVLLMIFSLTFAVEDDQPMVRRIRTRRRTEQELVIDSDYDAED
jgi:DNA-binding CsgD family transcriptional regulator